MLAKARNAGAILIALALVRCLESPPEAQHCPDGTIADSNEGGPTGDGTSIDMPIGVSTTIAAGLEVAIEGDGGARLTESEELAPPGVRHFTPVLTFEQLDGISTTPLVTMDFAAVDAQSCQPVRVFAGTDGVWTEQVEAGGATRAVVAVGAEPVHVVVARVCDAAAVWCDERCVWPGADETCLGCDEGCEDDTVCVAGACDGTRVAGESLEVAAAGDGFAIGAETVTEGSFVLRRIDADGTSTELASFTATRPSIAIDGDATYFADGVGGTTATVSIRRVAAPGATPEDVVTGRFGVEGLASDGQYLYWAESLPSGGEAHVAIARAELAGGPVEILSEIADATVPRLIGLDPDLGLVIYKTEATYFSTPVDGGEAVELGPVLGEASAVSAGFLYFSSDDLYSVERVSLETGEVELLNEGLAPVTAIAVDGEEVFWVESETESWPSIPFGKRHRLFTATEEGPSELRRMAGSSWQGVVLDPSAIHLGTEAGLEIVPR